NPRVGGFVHGRQVGRAGPRRHRYRPDDAAQGREPSPAVALNQSVHHRPYLRTRYCSKEVFPSIWSGLSSLPSATCRLNLIGMGMLTSLLLSWRALSQDSARLLNVRTSGPPKSARRPAGLPAVTS